MLDLQRVTEFGVERKPGNKGMKKYGQEVTEMRKVLCPNHMSVKRQGFAAKSDLEVAEGSKEDLYLTSGNPVTWNVGEKTVSEGHEKGVFREPPNFREEVMVWRSFRRELKVDWTGQGTCGEWRGRVWWWMLGPLGLLEG